MNTKKFFTKIAALALFASALAFSTASAAEAFDERPVPLKTPPPEYPADMQRQNISGVVAIRLVIDESGTVAECTISKSSHVEFEQAAIDAVRRWKFKPASKGGVAVKSSVVIPIKFTQDA